MSVAISWANKKQLAKCAYMVGFPIFSHIYIIYYIVKYDSMGTTLQDYKYLAIEMH